VNDECDDLTLYTLRIKRGLMGLAEAVVQLVVG
jgi:hypothetical protein